ncbi:hypothetical protein MKW92_011902 [Papaver armeniacum]|nr:hypothetical protein MKW92_011902 [Papaver armeniacum]
MEKPAAERKHHFFSILHEDEEEEENRRLREGPESSSSEPLDAKKLRRMALIRESSRTFRLRNKGYVQKLETSRIVEPAEEDEQNRRLCIPCENSTRKKKSSSSQEKFAAAGAIPREVMSFSSPFPFFWTSMNSSSVGLRFRMTIPLKFAREHLLAEITNPDGVLDVLLQNEEGLSWEVLVRPVGSKYAFCTGWRDVATENKLKIGDFVIFELIDRLPDSTFAMNFHIRRISVSVQASNGPEEACFTRNIPVAFAREHLPTNVKSGEEKMDVLLQNEEGCSWELHLCSRGFAKYYFSKGWKTFAMENKLSIGDCVLFELIDRLPGGTLVMNFHIYQSPVLVEDDLDDE